MMGCIFQARQHGRAVSVLNRLSAVFRCRLMVRHADQGGFSRERIILLGKPASVRVHRVSQLLSQHCHKPVIPVPFQRKNRPLVGQAFRLSAPVVFRGIAECRVTGRYAGQRKRRPEFCRIQQMLFHKPVRHILGNTAPVHAPQGIVAQDIHRFSCLVPVIQGAPLCVPQTPAQCFRRPAGLLLPYFAGRVSLQAADLGNCAAGSIAPACHIHAGHGHGPVSFRRFILLPPAGSIPVTHRQILPCIIYTEGGKHPVSRKMACFPQAAVKTDQAFLQLTEIIRILSD